ncbi:MAG: TetR/AcrR family transcriptional regulator [Polyangiales bacterium]
MDLVPKRGPVNAERLLTLLWRAPRADNARGPRPGLQVDDVVDTALTIADEEGIAGLTIREVADRLGVAPMSVYTYVPSKADLLVLMLDAALGAMPRSDRARSRSWRVRITAVADDNRRLYQRHPWIVQLPPNRPPLGPGTLGKYEHELGALEGTGLGDVARDAALTYVLGFVESCAHASARVEAAIVSSGMSDAAWWDAHGPVLARLFDASQYPLGMRIGAASAEAQGGAYDADHAYRFGLARVLDGLAALIARDGSA